MRDWLTGLLIKFLTWLDSVLPDGVPEETNTQNNYSNDKFGGKTYGNPELHDADQSRKNGR